MPEAEKNTDLHNLLKELLASTAAEGEEAPAPEATDGIRQGENHTDTSQSPPWDVVLDQKGGPGRQPQAYEVEIIAPEAVASPPPAATAGAHVVNLGIRGEQQMPQASPVMLDGKVEVQLAPPVSPAAIRHLEQAVAKRGGVRWLGTWGKAKEGARVHLMLDAPALSTQLFEGIAYVQWVEREKRGKNWQVEVSLALEGGQAAAVLAVDPPRPFVPAMQQEPAVAPLAEPVRAQPDPLQPDPAPVYFEPLEQGAASVDLEVSPIDSLDALNRFERLLSSFSPGCRVVNVLSLDGVSTVLITLEGINRGVLGSRLKEKIGGIKVEAGQERMVAQLPEKW